MVTSVNNGGQPQIPAANNFRPGEQNDALRNTPQTPQTQAPENLATETAATQPPGETLKTQSAEQVKVPITPDTNLNRPLSSNGAATEPTEFNPSNNSQSRGTQLDISV